jgi:hypothetical protein
MAVPFTRRNLFPILPAGAAGCLGCARTAICAAPPQDAPTGKSPAEKADLTWEQIFRFAYQKDLIPLLNEMAAIVGREKFIALLRDASDATVRRKTAGRPPVIPNIAAFAAGLKNPPPLIQHTLEAEIVEQTADSFEYRVKRCLWAKVFRESNAADIGYAMICYPDYAVARSLNPKLELVRTKTLMQGDDSCGLRYVMKA